MIALRSVSLRSRATGAPVLDQITLELAAGEVAVVTGPSGSGKTALTRLVYAAARPDSGQVLVFDRDLARLRASSLSLLRRRVAVVPQEMALLERESAVANAAAPLAVAAVPRREAHARAAVALARFGLAELGALPVSRLSSGQRRRVCLARAAVAEPSLLVADDPTAHLDADGRLAFVDLATEISGRGGAALVASSDPALVAAAIRLNWRVVDLSAPRTAPGAAGEPPEAGEEIPNVVPFPLGARAGAHGGRP
ncbi:MAG TPA: ATP-binding cassette domain-containing protein [Kofleriaceae bacterium]|nr:ATP-binding cassette domain-containing protein [Kofleriaceae bacterium]